VRVLYVTGLIVLIDQISKFLVKGFSIPSLGIYHEGMHLGQSIPLLGDFFRLTFVENPGMAFGIDTDSKLILTLFTLLATIGIAWYLFHIRQQALIVRLALALILAGAIGNLIDRMFYGVIFGEASLFHGKVVDFFDVDFFDISIGNFLLTRWFVFNVADASVSVGIVLLLLSHRHVEAPSVQPAADESAPPSAS
jgi:signal peptidase II